jgi:hypothetical protein
MDPRELSSVMAQLKGAPLFVLCTLLGIGRPLGRNELATITTYSPGSVTAALQRLEFLGLAARSSRYGGWLPTSVARQLPFVMPSEIAEEDADAIEADNEVQNLHLRSSSSFSSFSLTDDSPEETTPTTGEVQILNLPLDEDAEEALAALVEARVPERTAKGKGARDAVEAALAGGWTGAEALAAVQGWLRYAATPAGSWITHAGFLAAARVARRQQPPAESAAERRERVTREALEARWS